MTPNLGVEALAELARLVQLLQEEKDPQKLLELVMDTALSLTKAERGFLILVMPPKGMDVRVARNLRKELINHPKFQVSKGVILETLRTGKPVMLEDAKEDEVFGGRRSVASMRLASVACVPLQAGEKLLGVARRNFKRTVACLTPDLLSRDYPARERDGPHRRKFK